MVQKDTPDEIAANWVARLDQRPLTQQEQSALQHWLEADVRHKGAFLRNQAIWHATDRAKALYAPTLAMPSIAPRLSRRAFIASAAAASLAAMYIPARTAEASTRYGTLKNILHCQNAPSYKMVLDCYSQLEDHSERTDVLSGRCFVSGMQRLVATQKFRFLLNGSLLVTKTPTSESSIVIDGTAIMHGYRFAERKALSAGAKIVFTPQGKLHFTTVDPETLDRLTAWTQGQVSLETETLSEAADIFNKYNEKQLVISFRAADMRLSGLFDLNRPDIFAHAAQSVLGGRLKEDPHHIFLE